MRARQRLRALAAVALSLVPVGCVSMEPSARVDRTHEVRTSIRFENADAARLFAQASKHDANPTETDSYLLACLLHKQYVIPSDAGRFNFAAEKCDTNRDGVITYDEAWYYWNLLK